MKLEYLADGSPDCPLLRLYDFTLAEAEQLRAAIADLGAGTAARVEVHRLPFIEPVGGCRLSLVVQSWDGAIIRRDAAGFECGFRAATWETVVGLVEPFAAGGTGFQWLAGVPGEADLLLSVDGRW